MAGWGKGGRGHVARGLRRQGRKELSYPNACIALSLVKLLALV